MEISLFVPLFCHFLLLLPSSIPIRKQKTFYSCWRRAWWVWRRWHAVDGPFEMKARPSSLSSAVCARAVSIYWPTSWTVPVCFLFLSLADSVLLFQQKRNLFFMSVPCCSIHPLRAPKKKSFSSSSNSLFECSLSFSWKQDKKTNKQSSQLIKTRRALGPELLLDYVREPCIGRVVVVVGQRGAPNIITRRPRSAFGELWNLHINRK